MTNLGYNYRITDFQCALGISQLAKLPQWIQRRQEIANIYNIAFEGNDYIKPLEVSKDVSHSYHLYVVRIDFTKLRINRAKLFTQLKHKDIGVNVHYIPVHLHPFYTNKYKTKKGDCPIAELVYEEIISLPIYPAMADEDVRRVIGVVQDIITKNAK
jgi:perosamine synthetase